MFMTSNLLSFKFIFNFVLDFSASCLFDQLFSRVAVDVFVYTVAAPAICTLSCSDF